MSQDAIIIVGIINNLIALGELIMSQKGELFCVACNNEWTKGETLHFEGATLLGALQHCWRNMAARAHGMI